MIQTETRYPCPVCPGAVLQKSAVLAEPRLVIDHCARCGGVWFDYGEVQQMRRMDPKVLWALVAPHTDVHQMQCHHCYAFVTRDESVCHGCGNAIRLDCPTCGDALQTARHHGLRLDACAQCKGVWFDRHELDAVWRAELNAAVQRSSQIGAKEAPLVLVDALTWDPWLTFYGIHALSHVGAGSGNVLAAAGEAVGSGAGVVAEAASSVFETIVEFIGSIFG